MKKNNFKKYRKTNSSNKLTPEELKKIRTKERGLNYVLWLLGRRNYTQKELRDKMLVKEYPLEIIESILNYIKENNYQSDEIFAETYVRNNKHKYGKLKLKQKLKEKGVEENLIEDALHKEIDLFLNKENEEELNFNLAQEALLKKFDLDAIKQKEDYKTKGKVKIIRFMTSRGFIYQDYKDLL